MSEVDMFLVKDIASHISMGWTDFFDDWHHEDTGDPELDSSIRRAQQLYNQWDQECADISGRLKELLGDW